MSAEWRKIAGFSNYEISDTGGIRSFGKKFRSTRHLYYGYILVHLIDDVECRKTLYLHKLLAEVFLEHQEIDDQTIVIHLDGNIENNNVHNLKIRTVSNVVKTGLHIKQSDPSRNGMKFEVKLTLTVGKAEPLNPDQKRVLKYLRDEEGIAIYKLAILFRCSIHYIRKTLKLMGETNYFVSIIRRTYRINSNQNN